MRSNNKCPKCKGTLIFEADIYGDYYSCIICGNNIIINFGTLFGKGKDNPHWGVQTKTKKK
jgi:hypothetical protein